MHWRELRLINSFGERALATSPELTAAVERFLSSQKPEEVIGGETLGSGSYSSARRFGGYLVKVSSATTNSKSHKDSRPGRCEDLFEQFRFLSNLHDYLQSKHITAITTPRQYFAYRSRYGAYLLCQQYMDGWVTFKEWVEEEYDAGNEADVEFIRNYCEYIRWRLVDFAQTAGFERGLNDLKLEKQGLHAKNILVPAGCNSSPEMPLCIIDQPCLSASPPKVWQDVLTWLMGCVNLNFVPNRGY